MPLLAYCVMESEAKPEPLPPGVGDIPVEQVLAAGLRCFFSRFHSRDQFSQIPPIQSALAFHHVLKALFEQAAIIGFRFPTVVEDEPELLQYLREHEAEYREALARLRHMVQMEIHIAAAGELEQLASPSGREYLQMRQQRVAAVESTAERFHRAAGPWIVEWRQRWNGAGMRCYALLSRDAVAAFRQAAQALTSSASVRLTGPWPPSEFVEVKGS